MQRLLLVLADDDRPKLTRVAEAIRTAVQEGRLRPDEKLPSTRDLAAELDVHRQTIMQALETLQDEGWIISEPRKGYRVAKVLPNVFYARTSGPALKNQSLLARVMAAQPALPQEEPPPPVRWNFRSGRSDLRLFPIDELRSSLVESLRRRKEKILDYGHPEGYPALLEELSHYLRLVRSVGDRDILVTNGCQEAIYLCARLLISPGDTIAVEKLAYPFAIETLRKAGAALEAVAIDHEGMQPEVLEALCQTRRVKLLFLTPNHHFPTTATMSMERRSAIYQVAARHSILILEDDFDHEYHYISSPPAPIAANDPEGLVIYISSLSKIMFPSARIGFIAIPRGAYAEFLREKILLSIQSSLLIQDAIAHWMRTGGAVAHLNKTRRVYQKRLDHLLAQLQLYKDQGLNINWVVPDGGMAVWINTPWNTAELAQVAERHGILLLHETPCRVDGLEGTHIRLGFARHNEAETAEGLRMLFDLGSRLEPFKPHPGEEN